MLHLELVFAAAATLSRLTGLKNVTSFLV